MLLCGSYIHFISSRDFLSKSHCNSTLIFPPHFVGEYWVNERFPTAEGMPLYNSMLGGEGDSENNYCVVDAPWALPEYTTDYLCADNEEEGKCCLKVYGVVITW